MRNVRINEAGHIVVKNNWSGSISKKSSGT